MTVPPWPLAVVTGFLGAGKTTLIGDVLRSPDMRDTAVVVNEFGAVGLDHHLIKAVTDNIVLLPGGCLCCSVRQDLVRTLRDLHLAWRAGAVPSFARVLIETSGLAEPAPLISSLATHPLLTDGFALAALTTLVDAQHGAAQLAQSATCRSQIAVADHLIVTKCDLVDTATIDYLREAIAALNPIADIRESPYGPVPPDRLFARTVAGPARPMRCDAPDAHLAGIHRVMLPAPDVLSWPKFQRWLHGVLTASGSGMLRLKGCLRFAEAEQPMIVQAVRHTFYPLVEAPAGGRAAPDPFLVFIFEGDEQPGLAAGLASCRAGG
jgi:G3E family GTPase